MFRHRLSLAAIAFIIFVETVDSSIVPLALPSIAADFGADYQVIQWVVLVSVLTQASLSLVVGWLGTVHGNRRVLMPGLVLVGVSNVLCALSPTLGWLIAFRLLQAIGMTLIGALILAITTQAFAHGNRAQGFGFVGAMVSCGIVIGPAVGGFILEHLHWRMVFVFDLLFLAIALPLALTGLDNPSGSGSRKFDMPGAVLFCGSLLAFLLATSHDLSRFPDWTQPALYALAGICLTLFVRQELRSPHAMLDLSIFRMPSLTVYLAARYVGFVVFGGVTLLLPFYLETLQGISPDRVGILYAISPAFFGLSSWLSGNLTRLTGSRPLVLASLLLLILAYSWLGLVSEKLHLWQFIAQMILLGLGSGMMNAPSNDLIFGSAGSHNMSMLSGLTTLARIHARATGIAILGNLWGLIALAKAPAAETGSVEFRSAQISGFGDICLLGAFILVAMLAACAGETWVHRRTSRQNA